MRERLLSCYHRPVTSEVVMRRVVAMVCSLLASSCGGEDEHGPPPTCLADNEGLGRWEYLPTPHYERNLVDPQGTGPLAPSSGTMV